MITIHFTPKKKLYEQIYDYFIKEIRKGNIHPSDKLPSRRSLSQHLGVSLNTVKMAYDQLLDEGYIISKERSGFYVDKLSPEKLPKKEKKRPPFLPPSVSKARFDFSSSAIDTSRMPFSVLKKCAQEAIKISIEEGKGPKGGIWALREEIAKYLEARRNVICHIKNIIITSGYTEHLVLLMALIKHAHFAMEDPGYQKNKEFFEGGSKKFIHIPIDQYGFSVKDVEKTKANIAIVTPNHQFPTGIIMGLRRRQRLLAWAGEKKGRFIVEDDYDSDFKYTGKPVPALKSLDTNDQVILSGSFSASVGPFLGISYLVLPNVLRERFEKLDIPIFGPSVFQQYTLEKFLSSGSFEKHINRMNTLYRKKREIILKRLKQEEGIEILGAEAGLHFILRLDHKIWNLSDSQDRLKKQGISVATIEQYATRTWPKNDFILGFGAIQMQHLEEGIEKFLQTMKK